MANPNLTSHYGWNHSQPEATHAWVDPAALAICAELKPVEVLDLGCGNAILTRKLVAAGYRTTGCDPDPTGVEIARETVPGAEFHVLGAYDDPEVLGLDRFDVVVAAEVIEHLFLPRRLLAFAHAVLKPGGYLIVSTPYHGYVKNLAVSLFDRWDARHDVSWDYGHVKFYSRKTLTAAFVAEHFAVLRYIRLGRAPWRWDTMLMLGRKAES